MYLYIAFFVYFAAGDLCWSTWCSQSERKAVVQLKVTLTIMEAGSGKFKTKTNMNIFSVLLLDYYYWYYYYYCTSTTGSYNFKKQYWYYYYVSKYQNYWYNDTWQIGMMQCFLNRSKWADMFVVKLNLLIPLHFTALYMNKQSREHRKARENNIQTNKKQTWSERPNASNCESWVSHLLLSQKLVGDHWIYWANSYCPSMSHCDLELKLNLFDLIFQN